MAKTKDLWGKDVIEELTPHGLEIKPTRINPRFEFEERVRGYVPTENIKLIDILQLPLGQSDVSEDMLKLLGQLSRANIPIIKVV